MRAAYHVEKGGGWPTFLDDPDADQRACLAEDPDLFFPERDTAMIHVHAAKQVCARCPLLDRCREWALSRPWHELYGVWGGMTQQDRRAEQQQAECPRCGRNLRALKRGKLPRHMAGYSNRWCV